MNEKTLIIICTRNNSVLLQNFIDSIQKFDAGSGYDLVIADNSSDDQKHLNYLNKISNKYKIEICENDRSETTFNKVSKKYINNYDYFFFVHDDTYIYKDKWLKTFIDRQKSNYHEPEIHNTHLVKIPIGRVGSSCQYYRDFYKFKGQHMPTLFLKECLELLKIENLWIYKHCDLERVLYTKDCLKQCQIWNIEQFKDIQKENLEFFQKIENILNNHLKYFDEGVGPKNKYPSGFTWNKILLLTEFLNAACTLASGFRTISLEGDGYIEATHGRNNPFGMNYICHFGSPHMKRWLSDQFKCPEEDIHKKLYSNNFPFILQCDKLISEYYL